jgi:hypothetical protein
MGFIIKMKMSNGRDVEKFGLSTIKVLILRGRNAIKPRGLSPGELVAINGNYRLLTNNIVMQMETKTLPEYRY